MVMKTLIAVPTYKRHYLFEKQKGVYQYLPWLKDNNNFDVILFLKEGDDDGRKLMLSNYKCVTTKYDWISELRYQIINYAIDHDYTYLIFMDDDLKLAYKTTLTDSLHNITEEKFHVLLLQLTSFQQMTHPVLRFGSHDARRELEYNEKAIRCVSLYLPQIKQLDIHQDKTLRDIKFKSDYYLQLSLINAGCNTLCLNLFTEDDSGLIKGGCENRDPKTLRESAYALKKAFPSLVKLRWKQNSVFTEPTVEVTISWKKGLTHVK
jgi:hypothetical protein